MLFGTYESIRQFIRIELAELFCFIPVSIMNIIII